MIRGTTAQYKFKLPYSYSQLTDITIKFWQDGNTDALLPIIKSKTDCTERVSKELYVSLRPYETASFSDKYKAKMQLRATASDGSQFGCKEQLITVYPMPDDIIVDYPEDIPSHERFIVLDGGEIVTVEDDE